MPSYDIIDQREAANQARRNQKVAIAIGGPGGPTVFVNAGAPAMAAVKGSLCVDITNAKLYICTVAAGTWVVVGTQS